MRSACGNPFTSGQYPESEPSADAPWQPLQYGAAVERAQGDRCLEAAALASLVSRHPVSPDALPDPADLAERVEGRLASLSLARPAAHDASADDDPRAFLWWLLRMAVPTYRRLVEPSPAIDEELLRQLQELLEDRPPEDASHAQLHVDPASTLRRAELVRDRLPVGDGPVLAVGDDDGVTLALALLGVRGLAAVDIDPRLLDWLGHAAARLDATIDCERVDVFEAPVPRRFRGSCAAVITDPARSFEDCEAFLQFGGACLRADGTGRLAWADHPDWNFEYDLVVAALPELRLRLVEVVEDVHAYPLVGSWRPDARHKAEQLGVDAGWLEALLEGVKGWTHFHVLALDDQLSRDLDQATAR